LKVAVAYLKDHFDNSQMEQGRVDGKKKLKWNAVPTLFLHRKVSLKKVRKPPYRQQEETKESSVQPLSLNY
jgi:hypothetical protein